nr:type I polyketide synthase [Nocardia wallacei]
MTVPTEEELLTALRIAVKENHALQRENDELRARPAEPIAVVGMACRFPGGIETPEQLWEMVAEGRDVIGEFPADRGWDPGLFDPEPGRAGRTSTRYGGFLADVAEFDAGFFGIGPREARVMDPQQRQVLEVSWEALERSGLDPKALRGTDTGVFVGSFSWDYLPRMSEAPAEIADYLLTTNGGSVLPGRVSYTLGLTGPAIAVDTACSSSLVALHVAAQSLRGGECSLALAGGVTVMSTPGMLLGFSRQHGLAPDGRCKSFGAGADGVGLSEGVGILVLERLRDAHRHGHEVLAVLRGSAVNQDGASNGLTAPHGPAQQRVIRAALAAARLTAADIDVVEAHGTGTTLGDPIEAQAVLATYGRDRAADRPVWLGSIKSNMGHTQAAAGVAGVIKMIQAMRHGTLPPTLHADAPSPHVDWSAGAVALPTRAQRWRGGDRPRRAAVSSFGLSGTNAHVVLEQAPNPEPRTPPVPALPRIPWMLAGRTERALRDRSRRLVEYLDARTELAPTDIGAALARRSAFEHRAVLLGTGRAELRAAATALAAGERTANVVTGQVVPGTTAFVFAGQGSQRLGMGRELYDASPVFAAAWDEVVTALRRDADISLAEVVWGTDRDLLDRTGYVQAGLFAMAVALYRLLESWGMTPDFVMGHSVGEIAAAHVAGVLSLDDAVTLVAARGRLMQALPARGAMVAVRAAAAEIAPHLTDGVEIAAINGPDSVVISGDSGPVGDVAAWFAARGRKTSRLRVSHAFHSALMEPMLDEFAAAIAGIATTAPRIPIVSTVTGDIGGEGYGTAAYWVRHVRETVRFDAALRALSSAGVTRFVEVGPDGGLSALIAEAVDAAAVVPVLRAGRPETDTVVEGAARAFAAGVDLRWPRYFSAAASVPIDLPTYAFQHRRYWWSAAGAAGPGMRAIEHPMLSAALDDPGSGAVIYTGRVAPAAQPWLADHLVFGRAVLPGTALVELAIRVGDDVGYGALRELTLHTPMRVPDEGLEIRVVVEAENADGRVVTIHSGRTGGRAEWTLHARGLLGKEPGPADGEFTRWPPAEAEPIDVDDLYRVLAARGYAYGESFRGVTAAWRRGGEWFADVALPAAAAAEPAAFGLHPALLDAALHIGLAATDEPLMPFAWSEVTLHAAGAARLRVALSGESSKMTVRIADAAGRPVLTARSVAGRPTALEIADPPAPEHDSVFRLEWLRRPLPPSTHLSIVEWTGDDDVTAAADAIVVRCVDPAEPDLGAAAARTARLVRAMQRWLSAPGLTDARLLILTRGAVATPGESISDLAGAAVWGLARAARAENPDRIVVADVDTDDIDPAALLATGEPELAVRGDAVWVPRLARAPLPGSGGDPVPGTVLITGGTGGLGATVARHVVSASGVRNLLLLSRSGPSADGAAELAAELTAAGATVRIESCDVADRESLRKALATLPADAPLSGVVHTAGVLDDAVVQSLDAERIAKVFAPKVLGAWHLHELTADLDLSLFVLFSSVSGVLGGPGQGNYAAANAVLDALAEYRRARGLPGASIAWGPWAGDGMAGRLAGTDRQRMARAGLLEMPAAQALSILDGVIGSDLPVAVAARLDHAALERGGFVPPILERLVRRPVRPVATSDRAPRASFAGLTGKRRRQAVLDLVTAEAATILGYPEASDIDPHRPFLDLGFDSLSAVELRNRLRAATGLSLPATVAFDHPTSAAMAEFITGLLGDTGPAADDDDRIRAAIAAIPPAALRASGLLDRLLELAGDTPAPEQRTASSIQDMSEADLIRLALGNTEFEQ